MMRGNSSGWEKHTHIQRPFKGLEEKSCINKTIWSLCCRMFRFWGTIHISSCNKLEIIIAAYFNCFKGLFWCHWSASTSSHQQRGGCRQSLKVHIKAFLTLESPLGCLKWQNYEKTQPFPFCLGPFKSENTSIRWNKNEASDSQRMWQHRPRIIQHPQADLHPVSHLAAFTVPLRWGGTKL